MNTRSFALIPFATLAFVTAAHATVIQVEGLQDSLAGAPTINHCTLRKAIINANDDAATYPQCQAGSGVDEIVFNLPGTVTFALAGASENGGVTGDLDIRSSIIITGHPDGTVIDAASLDRVFHINPDNNIPGITVTLNDLHLRNGRDPLGVGGGGLQANNATVNLNNVTFSGNRVFQGDGGALYVANNSTLNLTNCTISGNTADHHAAALVVDGGTANIASTTITGNASGFSNLTGGIRALGTVNLRNTIVAGNGGVDLPNLDGTFVSQGYNIIGNLGTMSGNPTIVATIGDQIGVADATLSFGPLQNNGGATPTRALLAGSIAIDKGHSGGLVTDQRGLTRPCDLASAPNAAGGDGADVGAFETQGGCVAANQPPVAGPDSVTVAEDSVAAPVGVLINDSDPDGDALSVIAVSQGAHGAVAITGGGTGVAYTPNPDSFGSDSFTYTIADGHGGESTATVSVTVTNVPDAPDAVNDTVTVAEDSGATMVAVLTNDTDADGDALSVTAVTQGTHGAVANNGSSVGYTPAPNFFGTDSFTYTVSDGHAGADTATVSVTVTNVNDPPSAAPNAYTLNQDTTLNVPAPGVLGNDTDPDGDGLLALLFNNVAHGTLGLNANGSFTYTPHASFAGTDGFTYWASDGAVLSPPAAVTLTVHDTQAPAITAALAKTKLWPPNHDLVNVGFTLAVTDNSSPVTTSIAVYSDEGNGSSCEEHHSHSHHAPDATNIGPGTLRLRAERSGHENGRVYLVIVRASDPSANKSHACLTVVVPHSASSSSVANVNHQAQVAQTQCAATGAAPAGFVLLAAAP